MEKTRKKFKETKVGVFLKDKAPSILNAVGEFLPDQGGLGIVKNIISSDSNIEPRDKATALQLLEQDIAEMNNISSRWQSDMKSDSCSPSRFLGIGIFSAFEDLLWLFGNKSLSCL